ncbi:hypothetical protein ABE10_00395, partial [Bacillus toyonensis]|nr:hypothetical protein [Bacillus toyonensis]
ASARLDGDTQTKVVASLLLEKALHLVRGGLGEADAVGTRGLFGQGGVAHVAPRGRPRLGGGSSRF